MSDVQTLIEMGFPKNRALVDVESILNTKHEFKKYQIFITREKALAITKYRGVQIAMDWYVRN